MDIISLTLADKHLSSNGIPRLEFQIALGQKVTGITVLHSTAVAALKSWDTVGLANTGNV